MLQLEGYPRNTSVHLVVWAEAVVLHWYCQVTFSLVHLIR